MLSSERRRTHVRAYHSFLRRLASFWALDVSNGEKERMKVVCNERTEMEGQRVGDALLLPVSAGGAYTGAIPNLGTARNNHESQPRAVTIFSI